MVSFPRYTNTNFYTVIDHQENQYIYVSFGLDKSGYFSKVDQAKELQNRFRNEANIDVVVRVKNTLERVIGLPVRIAQEGDREYFAGLLRLINRSALLHADFGPYVGGSSKAHLQFPYVDQQVKKSPH